MTDFEMGMCANCPKIIELLQSAEEAKSFTGHMADEAMAPEFDEIFTPAMFNMFNNLDGNGLRGPEGEQINSPNDLAVMLRKNVGKLANYIDNEAEQELETATNLMQNCHGPLKMRASKAGRQIIATICNSPSLADGPSCEDVFIKRQSS